MIKRFAVAAMLGLVLGTVAMSAEAQNAAFNNTLMPQPAHLTVQSGGLALTPQFTAAADKFHDARLDAAIATGADSLEDADRRADRDSSSERSCHPDRLLSMERARRFRVSMKTRRIRSM